MRKIFTFILSLVMVLSMSTIVFAEGETGTITNGGEKTITFNKIYDLVNSGTSSPSETITFKIKNHGMTDTTETIMPSFEKGEYSFTTVEGVVTNEFSIDLPTYYKVGKYTYEITEAVGNTAGVDYNETSYYLVVTVSKGDEGLIRTTALHHGDTNNKDNKVDGINNTYSAGSLAISKKVTGNMGETDRYFAVNVTLNAPTNKDVKSTISISPTSYKNIAEDGTIETNPTSITVGTPTTFYLKDGETITLGNVPYGVTYTVVEDDYTGDDYDYDAATYNWSDNNKKVDSAQDTVTITNNKQRDVDTGIIVDNLPYIIILAGVVVGMGVFFTKKRTANNN
ncbi:FctA domain-containing protein [Clostridium sp. AL.422]|uniref:DUF7601 domain-containing protein n=1 Tax=Clostridium TaxID=1485 RepID=UPI00293DA4C0|nr:MULTISPECIES: FctA domain-containing protein [unclassified Clostridium]MDV4149833.1 FctA domain-containing protein [Clostridium sp. AL.422]